MPTEKDKLLSVASAEEWREWAKDPKGWRGTCLLCKAYARCESCHEAGGHAPETDGCRPHDTELTPSEAAIARLKRAGISEEAP